VPKNFSEFWQAGPPLPTYSAEIPAGGPFGGGHRRPLLRHGGGTSSSPTIDLIRANQVSLAGRLITDFSQVQVPIGATLTFIEGAVTGTFKKLPQGKKFTESGMMFRISYGGGVSLTWVK
jgi:hypothetical protein